MDTQKTKNIHKENIAIVRELLEKQRLVETIVQHDAQTNKLVESLVHRQHQAELQNKLRKIHSADLAHILEILPLDDRILVWRQVMDSRGGEILVEVSDAVRANLISSMTESELDMVLKQLDGDDLSYIADDIPKDVLNRRLESLSEDDQHWLRTTMEYGEDTVGFLMTNEMVLIREHETLNQAAIHLRKLKILPAQNDKLFVVDQRGVLKGAITLQTILLNDPDTKIADVMLTEIVKFEPDDNAREAAKAFERYDLVSAPVINARGKPVGRLTVDMVMDYIRGKTNQDVLVMAGIRSEEDLFSTVWDSAKNRGMWLVVNLFTAFIASRVIGLFENTISQLVALAALMPIVASIGGNTGNQTTALIIRALSLDQITTQNTFYLFRKEIGVSFINGIVFGLAVGLFAYLLYHNLALSAVIACAMLLTLQVAAIVGIGVPMLLQRYGRDPALGSSVILTAMTDSMGFFIFLGLASVFLL